MLVLIVVVPVVAVAVVVAVVLISRRRTSTPTAAMPPPPPAPTMPPPRAQPAPMTGLESALASVTDRDGRPLAEHLDDETTHVDDLRVPDDTGPLLRRALDHVQHRPDPADAAADADDPGTATESPPPTG